jgi:hypothetical protein
VATQLEELRAELEWIEYRMMSAHGAIDDLVKDIEYEGPVVGRALEDKADFHAVLAYATSFRRVANALVESAEKLQTTTLNEWQALASEGAAYWDRIDAHFREHLLVHEGLRLERDALEGGE